MAEEVVASVVVSSGAVSVVAFVSFFVVSSAFSFLLSSAPVFFSASVVSVFFSVVFSSEDSDCSEASRLSVCISSSESASSLCTFTSELSGLPSAAAVVASSSVSYTHLTLPTTPYV